MTLLALRLLASRALLAVPILIAVSILVFVILRLLPADPIAMSLPPGANAADYERLKADFGLDRSLPEQYVRWAAKLLTGDFGGSIYFRRPAIDLVARALPATLELITFALALGLGIGIGGGLLMYLWRDGPGETVLDGSTTVMMSIPEFLWAILFILGFGVLMPILPFFGRIDPGLASPPIYSGFLLIDSVLAGRFDVLRSALTHMVLPAVALSIGIAPLVMRVLRASLHEAMLDDYVTQARLRGQSEVSVLVRHALRNAALPTISLIGVQSGFLFGGTVLVELIFAYPGLGQLMVDAVRNHDLPVIQLVGLVYCALVLIINALVDVVTLAINPRLRQIAS